jgi:hypothetical protein
VSNSLEQRKGELLDGKRTRNYQQDAGGDCDVFFSECVQPLRDLKYAGFFDDLRERKLNTRGGSHIASVHIIGAISYNATATEI